MRRPMRMAAAWAIAVGFVLSVHAITARGAPSLWPDRDRSVASIDDDDPAIAADAAHRAYAALLYEPSNADADSRASNRVATERWAVIAALSAAIARAPSDVRLRFDLGSLYKRVGLCDRARPMLRHALAEAPENPRAADAWFDLAICDALDGDHESERAEYDEALAREDDPTSRAIALSNLGEAQMALGQLDAAIASFNATLALYPDAAVAWWNLALAHDRLGDVFLSAQEARVASSLDPDGQSIDGDFVFYEPGYERHWYQGLRHLARAAASSSMTERTAALRDAHAAWERWLDLSRSYDPNRPRARAHLAEIDGELSTATASPRASAPLRR